jgi:subtilisin
MNRYLTTNRLFRWTLATVVGAGGVLSVVTVPPAVEAQAVPDQYIVVLKEGTDPHGVAAEAAQKHAAAVSFVYEHALKGFAARVPEARLAALRNDPRVEFVEPDGISYAIAPPWAVSSGGSSSAAGSQVLPSGINHIQADLSSQKAGDGTGIVTGPGVAVLDTGIDQNHSDLYVAGGYNCTSGNTGAYRDRQGHGTHVAGTIAARDDGSGVVGVAPGVPLYAIKVLNDQGWGYNSWIIKGCDVVAQNAHLIKVANMSLGGSANDAIDKAVVGMWGKGVTVCVAAGNDGQPAANYSPARLGAKYAGIITVEALSDSDGAWDPNKPDSRAGFSNTGGDIIAPGVNILSTKVGGGTTTMSGTSMATPHVAGAAALASTRAFGPAAIEASLRDYCQGLIDGVPVACVKDY